MNLFNRYTTGEKFYLVPNDDMQDALEIDQLNFEFVVVGMYESTIFWFDWIFFQPKTH